MLTMQPRKIISEARMLWAVAVAFPSTIRTFGI